MGVSNTRGDDGLTWWFFSDSHFFHGRIIEYENRPLDHEERMWKGLSLVQEEDFFVHTGDVGFIPPSKVNEFLDRFPGQKKVLVEGNHDARTRKIRNWEGWNEVIRYKKVWEITIDGIRFAISHRPHELINIPSDICIHGHVHGKEPKFRWLSGEDGTSKLFVNACVEVNDYRPISLEDIKEEYHNNGSICTAN